jgi:hypothetical protein
MARHEESRVTTSIKIKPSLWKKFKMHALQMDKDLSDLIETLIIKELGESK